MRGIHPGEIYLFILVAAEVRRLNSISGFQLEPPHVGCYQSDLPDC